MGGQPRPAAAEGLQRRRSSTSSTSSRRTGPTTRSSATCRMGNGDAEAVQPRRDGHAQPPQDRPRVHPVRQRLRQRDQQRRRPRLVNPVPGQRLPRALLRRLLADLSRRRRLRHVDLQRRRPLGRRAQEGAIGPRLGRVLRRQARDLRPEAEGLVRALGGPGQGDAPVQVHRRHHGRQPQAADQPRGALLAAAPERPVPRRCLHPRIRGIQPAGQGARPDDHEPPLRPHRGDRPEVSDARAP